MSRVGEKIKLSRERAGMSQKQLAKKLGVSESFINEVESGKKVVNEIVMERISKVLGNQINDISFSFEEESNNYDKSDEVKNTINSKQKSSDKKNENQEVWTDAFSSILKNVPVYTYNIKNALSTRQLPVMSNKIEGFAPDKVIYIKIENDDMLGSRIAEGDVALCHITSEAEANGIYLLEHNGERNVREVRKLDGNRLLLISNKGTVKTETVNIKEVKIIAKLLKLEIQL